MTDAVQTSSRPRLDIASAMRLTELADYIIPFAIRAVGTLGVADHLVDGPLPVEELARRCGAEPVALRRALRALAGKEVFTEVEPSVFALTPMAELLRTDHPISVRDAYPLLVGDLRAWAEFDYSLRTGGSAFDHVHGMGYWEYMAEHPEESKRFDGSQGGGTRLEVMTVLSAYNGWGDLNTVVDVGGGNGMFIAGVLARYPHLRGTLFDQPHVVAGAPEVLQARGLQDRCEVVGGNFFEDELPQGADAYMLKRVLWSWGEDRAVDLLRAIRAAMRSDSRLLLLEPVVYPGDRDEVGKAYDLILLAMGGGGARTEDEVADLLAKADLRIAKVVPTLMFPLVEVIPAS